jgi:hypothetical protein
MPHPQPLSKGEGSKSSFWVLEKKVIAHKLEMDSRNSFKKNNSSSKFYISVNINFIMIVVDAILLHQKT